MIIHKSLNFREEDRVNIANRLSSILPSVASHLCIEFPFIQFYLFEGHFGIDNNYVDRKGKQRRSNANCWFCYLLFARSRQHKDLMEIKLQFGERSEL